MGRVNPYKEAFSSRIDSHDFDKKETNGFILEVGSRGQHVKYAFQQIPNELGAQGQILSPEGINANSQQAREQSQKQFLLKPR
jgi:hypothetical protein